jgi:thiamine biosynthesis protein ThiI
MTQTTMQTNQLSVTLRLHEVALKGKNRPFFIRRLIANVRRALKGLGVTHVFSEGPMLGVSLKPQSDWEMVRERLCRVFGVVKFARVFRVPCSMEAIENVIEGELPRLHPQSFRITANRSNKQFPLTSVDINRRLGTFVQSRTGAKVDLSSADLNIRVDILHRMALIYFDTVVGAGGLPVGTGGKVVCLMSGGIDSPVAAYRMMRRGCRVTFVHFHSFPLVEGRSREKARELTELLTHYQYDSRLYMVPFANLQREIVLTVPGAYRIVLYRRFMMRIGQVLAQREGALALVTGDSLGQVGSQTLENLATIEESVELPVLRPLVGMDKNEIIEQAKGLGSYETSILPDEDCCSLFVPAHPATRMTVDQVHTLEGNLNIDAMVQQACDASEVHEFNL